MNKCLNCGSFRIISERSPDGKIWCSECDFVIRERGQSKLNIPDKCKDKIHEWFGLSYSSWLTLPRVLMQEMPEDWQIKIVDLLKVYEDTFTNMPNIGTRVQITDSDGKLIKTPEWIINYRRPDFNQINKLKSNNLAGRR